MKSRHAIVKNYYQASLMSLPFGVSVGQAGYYSHNGDIEFGVKRKDIFQIRRIPLLVKRADFGPKSPKSYPAIFAENFKQFGVLKCIGSPICPVFTTRFLTPRRMACRALLNIVTVVAN